MTKKRVAVIGCGTISRVHLVSINASQKADLVAVADVILERAKKCATEFSCKAYTDYREMVEKEKPDCVHICLPHYLHAPVALWCMERGVSVLVEKPIATNFEDALLMKKCAEVNGVSLVAVMQNRYNEGTLFIEKILREGALGKILGARCSVTWFRPQSYYDEAPWRGKLAESGGGVIINQAIHTIDLMCHFVNSKVVRVDSTIAKRGRCNIEVEDSAEGIIEFENGVIGNFHAINCYSDNSPVFLELHLEKGKVQMLSDRATVYFNDGSTLSSDADDAFDYGNVKEYWGASHIKQIFDFYEHLTSGAPMRVSFDTALETHKNICDIYENARKKDSHR